jgi:hypothetical protein
VPTERYNRSVTRISRGGLAAGVAAAALLLVAAARADDMLAISAPGDITAAATMPCGQTFCAQVTYAFTVTGGTPPYTLGCNLASGGLFTVGSHAVRCSAQDSRGNSTPKASFTLTVTGGGSPPPPEPAPARLAISAPGDITAAATMPCGQTFCAQVTYAFTVTGGTAPYTVGCNLDSGGLFTVGSHTVRCHAQDSRGNSTPDASFTLTVTTPGGGSGGGSSTPPAAPAPSGQAPVDATPGAPTTPDVVAIRVPSTVTIPSGAAFAYVTVTSSKRDSQQTLCWHVARPSGQMCAASHGTWRVKIPKTLGKQVFVLRSGGKVVARKTVAIKRTS